MYGFWIKPDRYVNFQGLYAVYLNQLKVLAYRFEDLFTGKTVRVHEPGVDGYIIEAGKAEDITNYFKTYAMPKAEFVYKEIKTIDNIQEGTGKENIVPGSVLFATESVLYPLIVDNGNGILKKVDGDAVGTIDYKTGDYTLTIPFADFGHVVIGLAVVGTNTKVATITDTVKGITGANELAEGQIPGAQIGLTAQIITVDNVRKFFVGFTTNNVDCKAIILNKLTGKPVTVEKTL